jgi:hypothetical protein
MLRFVWKSLRHIVKLHLVLPIVVFVILEVGLAHFLTVDGITWRWFTHEFLPRLAIVYLTFAFVLGFVLTEEGAARATNLGALEGALNNATTYFAVSPTSAREWFDPAAQVYLARVVAAKLKNAALMHERVLLFYSEGDLEDVKASYLDGYHAKSLADWHMYFRIPVRFLRPDEIGAILGSLSAAQRKFVNYRNWWPRRFWMWRLKRKGSLAFAVVTHANGVPGIVRFHKSKHELEVTYHSDHQTVDVYSRIAASIGATASEHGHDFVDLILGVPGPQA